MTHAVTLLNELVGDIPISRASIFHSTCRLACVHCGWRDAHYRSLTSSKRDELEGGKEWHRIISWCANKRIPHLTFTGGEVTERDDLPELVADARWHGMTVLIETHGGRFADEEYCRYFAPGTGISYLVALHGSNAVVHDGITKVEGSFDATIEGLKNILRLSSSRAGVIFVISNYNAADLPLAYDLCRRIGVHYFVATGMILRGWAKVDDLPSLSILKKAISDAMFLVVKGGTILQFSNVPFCFMDSTYRLSLNFPSLQAARGYELMIHPSTPKRTFLAEMRLPKPLSYPKICGTCFFRDICPATSYVNFCHDYERAVQPISSQTTDTTSSVTV